MAKTSNRSGQITFQDLQEKLYNIDIPDSEFREYLVYDEENSSAFSPIIRPNPDVVIGDPHLEGAVAIGFLNSISRWRRKRKYRRRISEGWSGLKVVSEGDSWFQYPLLLDDVIDNLFDHYAILSLGAAGDLLSDMVAKSEYMDAIAEEKPDVFLISGGGNDMVGDGRLANMIKSYNANRRAENYPNARFDEFLDQMERLYRSVFDSVTSRFPSVKVLCHGYDYAIPNGGKWLGEPMESIGIKKKALQKDITRELIERFSNRMMAVAASYDNVFFVNCRNVVKANGWHDELHPKDKGFGDVASEFKRIVDAVSAVPLHKRERQVLCPGRENFVANPQPVAPSAYRRMVARRARKKGLLGSEVVQEQDRHDLEASIRMQLEKIDLGADFQPARFLRDGAARAAAVCRIALPGGFGTGFLVSSRNYIMTNNHVLGTAAVASSAYAEFGFEDGGETIRVSLEPERLFITDRNLDFSIVACDGQALGHIEPIPLLRDPTTITRDERINIVQHPRGRAKEIAIRNNKVTYVYQTVVHYRTDTEPGSSGSCAFNDDWELVALHHAGEEEPGGRATNEGIRMAAIVSHLIRRQRSGDDRNEAFHEFLNLVDDSSPFLGFFDVVSVAQEDYEVEVPDFTGTKDFADIGFWNIEHFNRDVGDNRVNDVADVVHRLSMDALGLVEVEQPALDRLMDALATRGNAFDYVHFNVRGRQDIAVVFDQDTTTVDLRADLNHKHRSKLDARTSGDKSAFPRDPLFAVCEVTEQNREPVKFMMIVVHFKAFGDAQSRERRRLASEKLAEIIDDIRSTEGLPVVLGGDFNEKLNNDVLSGITGSPDLVALTADDATTNAISYVGNSHRSLIDHIVISNDVQVGPISGDDAAIVRLDQSVADFTASVSDHVPIVIRVVAREQAIVIGPQDDNGNGSTASVTVPMGQDKLTLDFVWADAEDSGVRD